MKLSAFARVLALSGLAAAAIAQQPTPATPPKPATPAPPALSQVGPPAPESNLAPDAVVLTIGNQSMTRAQFEVLLSALAQNGRPAATPGNISPYYIDITGKDSVKKMQEKILICNFIEHKALKVY